MSRRLARSLATWFGCGYSPMAPGTVGSLSALVVAYLLHELFGWGPARISLLGFIAIVPGIWASKVAALEVGTKDPGIVVIDEVSGQWITLLGATTLNWKSWLMAFLLFRAFDIIKPPPVRQLEVLPDGAGIMADDVMAGIYSAVVLYYSGYFGAY